MWSTKINKIKYTNEYLEPIVKSSYSISEIIRKCGCKPSGGMHRLILERIRNYNICINHLTGQSWSKGKKFGPNPKYSDKETFCKNSPVSGGTKLRPRMIKCGFEYKCEICEISEWLCKKLVLHVDHINGISNDNRKENLRFLCPNCHQQTDTWGNKKD